MTNYKMWAASLAEQYASILTRTHSPIGLFLYDTPHTLIESLMKPVAPLLIEKGIPVELVAWQDIIELQRLSEPLETYGPELFYRGEVEAKIALDAYHNLADLAKRPHLLIVVGFAPPSNGEEGLLQNGAAQWLLFIADTQRKRINSSHANYDQLLWVLSPCTNDEWSEKFDPNSRETHLFNPLFSRLWNSCIFNSPMPPANLGVIDPRGLSHHLEMQRLPPLPKLSPIERILRDSLDIANVEYDMQYPVGSYRLDFAIVIDGLKLDVESDGQAYHSSPEQVARDRKRNNELTERGWIVLRYSGEQIIKNRYGCVSQILRTLSSHGATVKEYAVDESGAFVPPVSSDNIVEEVTYSVEQRQLEEKLRREAELDAQ
jgi:very-short-patch-repair endonuclease